MASNILLLVSLFLFLKIIMEKSCVSGDFLIQNAQIIDGVGSPVFLGSVCIKAGQITYVGQNLTSAECQVSSIIDAQGAYLSPGFIDTHTHDDVDVVINRQSPAKILQGVTTVITGNCGFSNYPNGDLKEVQDHLATLLGEIDPSSFFQNFSDYRSFLEKNGLGPNVGSLVGHGPLRLSVVGPDNRVATEDEILEMVTILEEQLEQGAIGLSLGLVYPPSAYAGRDELVALASSVAKYDRLLSGHIRSYEGNLLDSIDEFVEVLRMSGARGLLSHLQVAGVPYWGTIMPLALVKIQEAIDQGVDIKVDMYPYLAGSSSILQILPPSAMAGGFDAFVERLENDPAYYDELKYMTECGSEPGWESKVALIGWDNIVLNSVVNPVLIPVQGLTIPEGQKELGYLTEFDFFMYVVLTDEGMSNVIMFQQSEEDQQLVFQSSFQMVGSDSIPRTGGKPHPRMYGSFPKVLGGMALTENPWMTLEQAVQKCTSMAAERFGLRDRGTIRVGMAADLVMFTEDVTDTATYDEPVSYPTGILSVWVNGVQVVHNGEMLSNLPGVVFSVLNK